MIVYVLTAVENNKVMVQELFAHTEAAMVRYAELRVIWGGANVAYCARRVH